MQQIKREWEGYAREGDESPPWKQPDPQETIAHLIHENAQLRRDLKRAYEQMGEILPDAAKRLQALLDKRVKDEGGVVTEGSRIQVDKALIHDLLKFVQEEAVRKLATEPAPRIVIETKGEAKALLEMQQAELARLKADTRQFLAGIVQAYRDDPHYDLHKAVASMRRFIEQKL